MADPANTPATLSDLFFHGRGVSAGRPRRLELYRDGRRETLSSTDFGRQVHSLAVALEGRGLMAGERVAVFSENRPEWPVVEFACYLLGVATVPIPATAEAAAVAFMLRNSGARWVFYSDADKRRVLEGLTADLAAPPRAVAFEGAAAMADTPSFVRLLGEGAERLGEVPLERFRGRVREGQLATLLYASDAAADPQGATLSHADVMSNVLACGRVFDVGPDDLALSSLSPADGFQRCVDALCFLRGAAICYLPDPGHLDEALLAVRPTLLAAPAPVYRRAHRRVMDELAAGPAWRRRLARWALAIGGRYAEAGRDGFIGPLMALENAVARRLVHRRIRERFGGRLRLAISGGAPLPQAVGDFFDAVGLPLHQGDGLTETSPAGGETECGGVRSPR